MVRMTKRYISPQSGPVEGSECFLSDGVVLGTYTPDECDVKERYMSGEFVSNPMAEARWNRFIRKVRAKAWREGHRAAWEESGDGWNGEVDGIGGGYDDLVRRGMFEDNPYESEEA